MEIKTHINRLSEVRENLISLKEDALISKQDVLKNQYEYILMHVDLTISIQKAIDSYVNRIAFDDQDQYIKNVDELIKNGI